MLSLGTVFTVKHVFGRLRKMVSLKCPVVAGRGSQRSSH